MDSEVREKLAYVSLDYGLDKLRSYGTHTILGPAVVRGGVCWETDT